MRPMASTSQGSASRPHRLYENKEKRSESALDVVTVKGIAIAGWSIETQRGSIADTKTIDECSTQWGIPLPEMPFDKNKLVLRHEASGWMYEFDAFQALRSVDGVEESFRINGLRPPRAARSVLGRKPEKKQRVKVAHANEWGKKREQSANSTAASANGASSSNFGMEAAASGSITTARDYDWTYSCTWPGGEVSNPGNYRWEPVSNPHRDRIPVERLGPPSTPGAKAEPILFYDDIVLFEDELGDNGCSMLGLKVRVMPSGFLILQRFFLRVDNVVFRLFDTRMYVGFDDEKEQFTAMGGTTHDSATEALSKLSLQQQQHTPMRVIRECSGCQAKYADLKSRLPPYKPNDLSPLTDPAWVSQQLSAMQREASRGGIQLQDISRPAVLPSTLAVGQESNRILGEVVDEDQDSWEGEGNWVDVIVL